MRIIAGTLRGRRLRAPAGRIVRPTGDRMKASMFSALGDTCRKARVLDLYAGSGALGFEALSRGAVQATFVENNRLSLEALRENAHTLQVVDSSRIIEAEVFYFLGTLGENIDFDLIFADPPFQKLLAQKLLSWWQANSREGSVFVLEYPSAFLPSAAPADIQPVKTAAFGESAYSIYLAR